MRQILPKLSIGSSVVPFRDLYPALTVEPYSRVLAPFVEPLSRESLYNVYYLDCRLSYFLYVDLLLQVTIHVTPN